MLHCCWMLLLIKIFTVIRYWIIGMWYVVVAAISFIKVLYDSRKLKWPFYYVTMWGMVHTLFFITFIRFILEGNQEKINFFYHQLMTDFSGIFLKMAFAADKTMILYPIRLYSLCTIIGYLAHWLPSFIKTKYKRNLLLVLLVFS